MHVLASYAQRRILPADRRVLILDPDVASRHELAAILGAAGFQTDSCSTDEAAFEALAHGKHSTVVAHHQKSLMEGMSLARHILSAHDVSVILLTGDQTRDVVVSALSAGVFDFMTRSFAPSELSEQLLGALRRSIESERSATSSAPPSAATLRRDPVREILIGQSPLIDQARQAVRAAMNDAAPVLIDGEAGTEKLSVARLLHDASGRRGLPFVVLNTQSDSATRNDSGDPAPGTLFIPEVSSIDSSWQMELVKRLSELAASPAKTTARLVAGLNHPPAGVWSDSVLCRLFEGVGARHVLLPPLRDRGRDVLILAEHFAEQVRLARGDASLRITRTAAEALTRYGWPGNVDELRFAIQHAALLCSDSMIRVIDLPPSIGLSVTYASDESGTPLQVQSLEDMELAYILRVLDAVGGNKASAARLLGVDRTTLYRKLQRQEQTGSLSSEPPLPHRARK